MMHSGQSFHPNSRWGILKPLLLLARRKTQVTEIYPVQNVAAPPQLHESASADVYANWYHQGESLANQKLYAAALESFDQAIACNPEATDAWVFRGVVLIYLQQYEAALASCARAIAIDPNNQEAWLFHGVALHRLGHYQRAYRSYDQATEPNP
ncbi:MAG TPA: tetratricopeptide repeat protein [Leptolyngbyaceae cyanobacterium M33_DOE_097]|uniref:Tetratricopeptide repeat protein n=1 Tax=Oscillatoriales cyanobacterium SpSt-418 TaxID=2282169 RepID=A0A7C3PJI2_9CYAN|nr:tetratricopeptide repeat protein [Leptolyngbyaceae cyanobacterium M33_DOE_097]